MVMIVTGRMAVRVTIAADAADMVMVTGLRCADLAGVADDLGAVFAELAIHRRGADADLLDALGEGVEHQRMIAQIWRLDELDRRKDGGHGIGLPIDALDQNAGEEKIRKDDDAGKAEAADAFERRCDPRMGDAAEGDLAP